MKEGILIVNKPDGMTSHDVVDRVRRKFQMKRVGHAGTLDPLATGVLVVLVGKATKLFDQFVSFDKAYRATLLLGMKTTSADTEGEVTGTRPYSHITTEMIQEAFKQFTGEIEQIPPMFSAVKKNGKKLYQLARQGKVVERVARKIKIRKLQLEGVDLPEVRFYLECSKGTYVRQLAEDIGAALECGACISQIERTSVGEFSINDAINLDDIHESHILNWQP